MVIFRHRRKLAQGRFDANPRTLDFAARAEKNSGMHISVKKLVRLAGIALACSTCMINILTAADATGKPWTVLFNGKDLTGWKGENGVTAGVVDGNLQIFKGQGWLRTEKEYQDFNLELEWRAYEDNYDSGIYIRSGTDGVPWPKNGFQVNLRYNAIGALVKNSKTLVPAEIPKLPVNKWVKMRLEVRGKKAKLIINGEDNWETDLIDIEKGYLGIQIEDRKMDFRNIRIQEQ